MLGFMENCETIQKLHLVVCATLTVIFFLKPGFGRIGVFTKYGCFYASKWPQMPQKWVNTIPFGSGHTLGTLNHDLGPLFCCFISLFGAGGSLDPPGAPWCPLAPPCTTWCPHDPWYVILGHSQSFWVIMGHIWPIRLLESPCSSVRPSPKSTASYIQHIYITGS